MARRQASAVEAAHLMDTLDKDEDGVLSEPLGSAERGALSYRLGMRPLPHPSG